MTTKYHDLERLTEYEYHQGFKGEPLKIGVYNRLGLDMRAQLALDFVGRWGMVAGKVETEDTAGRARLELMSVDEVIDRACSMASGVLDKFHELGWTEKLASIEDGLKIAQEKWKRNDKV